MCSEPLGSLSFFPFAGGRYSCDGVFSRRKAVMFPYAEHLPTAPPEPSRLPLIALFVFGQFREPVFLVRLRMSRMSGAAMPEASIHEHQDTRFRKCYISDHALYTTMESESQACSMQCRTKRALGSRVLALDPFHDLRTSHRSTMRFFLRYCHEKKVLQFMWPI